MLTRSRCLTFAEPPGAQFLRTPIENENSPSYLHVLRIESLEFDVVGAEKGKEMY